MKIRKAIESLHEGKKIRRISWADQTDCLVLCNYDIIRYESGYGWSSSSADLLADDWAVVLENTENKFNFNFKSNKTIVLIQENAKLKGILKLACEKCIGHNWVRKLVNSKHYIKKCDICSVKKIREELGI